MDIGLLYFSFWYSDSLWYMGVSTESSSNFRKQSRFVSIPLEQGSVFRRKGQFPKSLALMESQSLWNRAVSSDKQTRKLKEQPRGLNPFGTGQCLPTSNWKADKTMSNRLNPFGTGQCLPTNTLRKWFDNFSSLNPFGTGQCLPT